MVLLNEGFPAAGSESERYYKPGGVYFEACSRGRLLLLEPDCSAFIHPMVREATKLALKKKAEAKRWSYAAVPVESQRYRFVALNEMGRMMVEGRRG